MRSSIDDVVHPELGQHADDDRDAQDRDRVEREVARRTAWRCRPGRGSAATPRRRSGTSRCASAPRSASSSARRAGSSARWRGSGSRSAVSSLAADVRGPTASAAGTGDRAMRPSCTRRTPAAQHPYGRMVGCAPCLSPPPSSPSRRSSWASRRARPRPLPRPRIPRAPTRRWRARPAVRCPRPSRCPVTSTPRPTVTFPAPLSVTATQRTVVIEGDGTEVQDGALTQVHFTLYNGETGAAVDVDRLRPVDAGAGDRRRGGLPARARADLRCSTVGSRIVGVVPASAAFGDQGNADLGVGAGRARGLRARSGRRRARRRPRASRARFPTASPR